ncbi:unnamed protein product [Ilex paraguariensis]|uniref:Uncharacterized protein n=1 Tax=Ilex paraguariensis TaxID=185542 RepID=A0ABC8UWB8_9AQUA
MEIRREEIVRAARRRWLDRARKHGRQSLETRLPDTPGGVTPVTRGIVGRDGRSSDDAPRRARRYAPRQARQAPRGFVGEEHEGKWAVDEIEDRHHRPEGGFDAGGVGEAWDTQGAKKALGDIGPCGKLDGTSGDGNIIELHNRFGARGSDARVGVVEATVQ